MQRIVSIDLARGFTVLFIPAIHSVMLYSALDVHQSVLGYVFAFIAEWPGAQVFMLLMGASFGLQKSLVSKKVITKALCLLLIGYLMNYLKFVLPIEFGVMPKRFLDEYVVGQNLSPLDLLLTSDILQFAALAILILLLICHSPYRVILSVYLVFIILLASPLLWDTHSSNPVINHLLNLLAGQPPYTYFPLFPWLVYPLIGFAIGEAIKQKHDKLWRQLFISGCFALLSELLLQFTPYHCPQTSFYRTWPDQTLMHLGFVVAWIAVWHFISIKISDNKFFTFLKFSSRNITLIYFIQWILIFWCFPLIGYQKLGLTMSIIVSVSMSLVVFSLTYFIIKLFK